MSSSKYHALVTQIDIQDASSLLGSLVTDIYRPTDDRHPACGIDRGDFLTAIIDKDCEILENMDWIAAGGIQLQTFFTVGGGICRGMHRGINAPIIYEQRLQNHERIYERIMNHKSDNDVDGKRQSGKEWLHKRRTRKVYMVVSIMVAVDMKHRERRAGAAEAGAAASVSLDAVSGFLGFPVRVGGGASRYSEVRTERVGNRPGAIVFAAEYRKIKKSIIRRKIRLCGFAQGARVLGASIPTIGGGNEEQEIEEEEVVWSLDDGESDDEPDEDSDDCSDWDDDEDSDGEGY